jgi:MFS transporter, FLVCR family, MFS-domain-containing protein 7
MEESKYKVFSYRWVILIVLVPAIIATEIFWLTFAPISSMAEQFYGVSSLGITMFSMSYMLMYIIFTIPASWVIDKYGAKASVLIGILLTAVFGIIRFAFADIFAIVLASQFFIAIGQPFLINISTKIPANWFPVKERATASGILVMAQYLGFIVPMVASPILATNYGIQPMLGVYAGIACFATLLIVFFLKEKPEIAPGPEAEKENLSVKSMKKLLTNKNFNMVLIISFIAMGMFNTLLTMIEKILTPRGISFEDAGLVGAAFIVAGIIGAVVLPMISDNLRKRVPLFRLGLGLIIPLVVGLTFFKGYALVMIDAAVLGFVIMGLAPILFQHGAEVAYPAREGTSFGLILMAGQISGVLFVYLFDVLLGASGKIVVPMIGIMMLTLIQFPISFKMRESKIFLAFQSENKDK